MNLLHNAVNIWADLNFSSEFFSEKDFKTMIKLRDKETECIKSCDPGPLKYFSTGRGLFYCPVHFHIMLIFQPGVFPITPE